MQFTLADTIAAIASAPGHGLRSMIRISGPDVPSILQRLLPDENSETPDGLGTFLENTRLPRRRPVRLPVNNRQLQLPADLYYWPTHRSFTGEVLAELHLIGSPPLLNEVLEAVLTCGARPAERGEFTLRAFLAGRIDLVQAEAVLGVIDAGNSTELETALAQLAGGISGKISALREQLLLHLADLEAGLDFVEEDIEFVAREELRQRLAVIHELLDTLLLQTSERMLSSGRFRVVLAGLPNAGKSTLFNRLTGQHLALVSSVAGTTRDYLAAALTHAGTSFDLIDTAGWDAGRDGIEAAADLLRDEQYRRANLILWCRASDWTPSELARDREILATCQKPGPPVIVVRTKIDARSPTDRIADAEEIAVSAQSGAGLNELLQAIVSQLSQQAGGGEFIHSTAARCGESLRHALAGVVRAEVAVSQQLDDELIALELREVLDHLGRIGGQVYTDDILDRIFSRFCIGK